MSTQQEIHNLVADLLSDLRQASILWQLGVLLPSLLCAWWLQRVFEKRFQSGRDIWGVGVGGINRLIFPLCALLLVLVARVMLHNWHSVNLLNIAVPLLVTLAIIRIAVYMLRHAFSPSSWLSTSERLICWSVWLGLALYITGLLPEILNVLDDFAFHVGNQRISLLLILQGLLAIAVTLLLTLWLGSALERRIMGASQMDPGLRVVLSKFTRALLVLIGALIVLPVVGIDLTLLSVFGGALGVGLGFGLQKVASNYVSGFIILLDRSIRPGDLVTVDNRYGEVSRLTTRYVVIKISDGTEAIIPNDTLFNSTVINHSYSDRRMRIALPIQVSYASPLEKAMQILTDAAKKHPRILQDPPPKAFVLQFGDNGIDLELGVWIADAEQGQLGLRSEIYLEIWREFQKQGIEIPYPQHNIRIINQPSQPLA